MFDVHFLNEFLYASKTAAMDRAEAKFTNGFFVGPGRVPFVLWKIELRIVVMVILHQAIPGNFGYN